MEHHLAVMGDKVRETFAFTDFESLEIYWRAERAAQRMDPA